MLKHKTFLERLTGSIRMKDEEEFVDDATEAKKFTFSDKGITEQKNNQRKESTWEEETDAELTCDVYQTASDIVIQTMVAGVQPDNLSITITRDMVIIRGKREENRSINSDNYFVQELYWGGFSRTISLPEEIDPEEAEAIEKHGLLIIKLPKVDKNKETKLKVKSI